MSHRHYALPSNPRIADVSESTTPTYVLRAILDFIRFTESYSYVPAFMSYSPRGMDTEDELNQPRPQSSLILLQTTISPLVKCV